MKVELSTYTLVNHFNIAGRHISIFIVTHNYDCPKTPLKSFQYTGTIYISEIPIN